MGLSVALLLMAGLEGVLRLIRFEYPTINPIVIAPLWPSVDRPHMERIHAMYRFHPYWFWELRPGAQVTGCGPEQINPAGYRGLERPRSPSVGTLRIVVLGDSSTFGWGVCGETYAALLERELPNTEVLNFGVPGFSAFQGEKLLEGRALSYHPQVILASFGAVDDLLPASGYEVEAKFAMTSRLSPRLVLWRDRLSGLRTFQLIERAFGRVPQREIELKARENYEKWNRGSQDYVRNQSIPSFERSLERIVTLGRSYGARVALIGPPRRTNVETRWPWASEYSAAIARVASRLNAPYWDARAAFRTVPHSDERLFLDDYHPNVAGHQIYAKFLTEKLLHEMEYESKKGSHRP